MKTIVEVCANGLHSAIQAQKGGANRIELCESLELGGLTPSYGTLILVKKHVKLPTHVLIRPRRGDFIYDNRLIDVMCTDIQMVRQLGYEGVVLGVLDDAAALDIDHLKVLMNAAEGMSVTFHRAIDIAADPMKVISQLIAMGVDRVLTSGGKATAWEGKMQIAEMQARFGNDIKIMAGSGINADNAIDLINATTVDEIHFSAKRVRNKFENDNRHNEIVDGNWWYESDEVEIRKMIQKLKKQ